MNAVKYTVILLLTILFQSKSTSGQIADNTSLYNQSNIYYQAIQSYLNFLDTSKIYSKFGRPDTLFIENKCQYLDSILSPMGKSKILLLKKPFDFLLENKLKSISLCEISPLQYKNEEFFIRLIPYGAGIDKKRRRLNMTFSDWVTIFFKFKYGIFNISRIELDGI